MGSQSPRAEQPERDDRQASFAESIVENVASGVPWYVRGNPLTLCLSAKFCCPHTKTVIVAYHIYIYRYRYPFYLISSLPGL